MKGVYQRRQLAAFLGLCFLLPASQETMAQLAISAETASLDEWHRFRDKEGHEIEARVVSLSSDSRNLRIERRDGQSFDLVVTRLSLDDQQYLKNWLQDQEEANPTSLQFAIALTKKESEQHEEKLETAASEAIWETTAVGYEVTVTSLSRLTASRLQLEYCLLLEDSVEIRESTPDDDAVTPRWRARRGQPVRYRFATVDLPPLDFNRQHQVETGTLVLDTITPSRGVDDDAMEDRVVGLMVRLVNRNGVTIAEKTQLHREYSNLDWASFSHLRDPSETEGSGYLVETIASN